MIDRIHEVLQSQCRITPDHKILVAVSGGPDSLCMLDILAQLGYSIIVAHFNHHLRPGSEVEASTVRNLAESFELPFILGQADIHNKAEQEKISLEEAGRIARYQFLFHQATINGINAVAVGHTADDQVETMLLHLIRGSGLSGLCGMKFYGLPNAWSREIPLVRPLLGVWRGEILEFISQRNLDPISDESNFDLRYLRNRLRHELIPIMEQYNPRFRKSILRMSSLLREDYAQLEKDVNNAWFACVIAEGKDYVTFQISSLRDQSLSIQRYLLRKAITNLHRELVDLDYQAIERGIHFLQSPSRSKKIELLAGVRMLAEGNSLSILIGETRQQLQDFPQLITNSEQFLPIPGTIKLQNNWTLQTELMDAQSSSNIEFMQNPDNLKVYLDFDQITKPLVVRTRKPGDRYQPLGMDGHSIKVSDLMINAKIPQPARLNWPLILSGDSIAWIPGFPPSFPFRVRSGTIKIAHLAINRAKQI